MKFDYEVLIIGGGPAGLSAAMTLGRIIRSALVCDDDRPRNAPSSHINNFPTRDGVHPVEWRKLARKDLEKYETIQFFQGQVLSVEKQVKGFRAQLSSGADVFVKTLILADGVKDKMPPIPGFQELWGKSIFHCPFCHGFEIRGTKLGFLISNEMAFHALPMIRELSSDLIVFTNGKVKLTDDQKNGLDQKKIPLIEDKIASLHHEGEVLHGIELADGRQIKRQNLFYSPELPFELKANIGPSLGCKRNELGFYEVNEMGETSVPGVFAAGDNMTMGHSVLLASGFGAKAGMGAIAKLLHEHE